MQKKRRAGRRPRHGASKFADRLHRALKAERKSAWELCKDLVAVRDRHSEEGLRTPFDGAGWSSVQKYAAGTRKPGRPWIDGASKILNVRAEWLDENNGDMRPTDNTTTRRLGYPVFGTLAADSRPEPGGGSLGIPLSVFGDDGALLDDAAAGERHAQKAYDAVPDLYDLSTAVQGMFIEAWTRLCETNTSTTGTDDQLRDRAVYLWKLINAPLGGWGLQPADLLKPRERTDYYCGMLSALMWAMCRPGQGQELPSVGRD